jgi:hypothetical protein
VKRLNLNTYLKAFSRYPSHEKIKGGTIHQFLRESIVRYYGGKCPVYYIEHYHNGNRCVIGGNYASNGKPELKVNENINF